MKKILLMLSVISLTFGLPATQASGGGVALQSANIDLSDTASLQRGAGLFVNYCLSCHSATFMRFNRMGKDLGISDAQLQENMMFATDKVGQPMTIAMREDDAANWFGAAPPDLSVVDRSRGSDWLYTYLLSFYEDDSRPWGVNNLVFRDVGMPHVLWERQGGQKVIYKTENDHAGKPHQVIDHLEPLDKVKSEAYKQDVQDLVNYMSYMGEPAKLKRYDLGVKVLLFLMLLFVVAYLMKKDFWRDIK